MPRSSIVLPLALPLVLAVASLTACASGAPLAVDMAPMDFAAEMATPAPLDHDPFHRDQTGALSEEDLRLAIEAPVFLAEDTRLGIVPVATDYEQDNDVPVVGVPEVLAGALDGTGFFEIASEVSTSWPSSIGVPGLRELAARYQTRYLLLYRHRFVERERPNGWAATYPLLVTIPFMPGKTLETAGVLEATMFDVRTGTILFTVYERVHAISDENVWGNERKLREMREELLADGADRLADKVVHQVHRLVAARPSDDEPGYGVTELSPSLR